MRRWSKTTPSNAAGEAELVEPLRRVVLDAKREHVRLPGGGGQFIAIQRIQDRLDSCRTLGAMSDINPLPGKEEPLKVGQGDRLNLRAQSVQGQSVNAR